MPDEFNQGIPNQIQPGMTQVPVQQPVVQQPIMQQPVVQQPVPSLPGASERTSEQFEKLIDSNKRLFEQVEYLKREVTQRNQATQQFAPVAQSPNASVPINTQDFMQTDPMTGERYIDEGRLQARISELNQKATRAEQVVQNYIQTAEQREVDRQNREAFTVYPELDPKGEKYNSDFSKETRAFIYDSMINPGDYNGRPLTFKEAADRVKARFGAPAQSNVGGEPANQAGDREAADNAQALKEQSSAAPASQSYGRPQQFEADEDLHNRASTATRLGDDEALAWRLTKATHTGERKGSEE